jgi:hypothetical protein
MKAVVFTPGSLFKLSQYSTSSEWFDSFALPDDSSNLKRIVIGEIVYLIESEMNSEEGPIVVINLHGEDAIFTAQELRPSILERIITAARSIYTDSVVIPPTWRPHREGCLFSIQAPSRDKSWRRRLHFDAKPRDSHDLFVFSKTNDILDFDSLDRHLEIYDTARQTLVDAILANPPSMPPATMAGITLTQRLPQGFTQGASLEQWYQSKLTQEQRSFVDKPHDGPVRLRGSAGTGKTLSLVIKFIRDALLAQKRGETIKLGFLVHSFASVDLVSAIAESLDTTGMLQNKSGNCRLEVRTLYDLAHDHLRFDLDELSPLSLDGREGRRLQFELIESVLKEMAKSPILRLQYAELSPVIQANWDAVVESNEKRFVAEIMNEFASVLDAEGIRLGGERGERYAKGGASARPSWLMALPSETDRRFILDIHRRYRNHLSEMNTLSVDQMIGDFNSFLDSNRWDVVRGKVGYDAIFVDELHLFTSIERQVLHKLIKRNIGDDGRPKRPPIFMAYDLKQSPRDTFIEYGEADHNLFGASTRLQNSELVKLEKNFRYTPQIAEFLTDLDATFPAIDIPGEWEAYAGKAELGDGGIPELVVFKNEQSLFTTVFDMAERTARTIDGGGRRVAVLCVSEDQFDTYVKIAEGRFSGRHLPITSRESSSELRHVGKRFILSMPEYVAGLQFDTVYLIHVDAQDAPQDAGDGVRRRFISNVYLGSSRAEKTLRISSCMTRGGMSDVLQMALDRGSLLQVLATS